jgi:NAD(P) transhydrogenase subunit alpha
MAEAVDPFVFRLSIFVMAILVGYYVVWSVTPALHTPLM